MVAHDRRWQHAASDVSACGNMDLKCAEVPCLGPLEVTVWCSQTARGVHSVGADWMLIRHVMLERHWNNGTTAMTDASGFRLFTQTTPPVNEIGTFLVGLPVDSSIRSA